MRFNRFALIIIILLAALLRFLDIDSNPKAMYGDELTLVYDAYSLSRTGMDQKGERFPLVFQLGGARPPGYVYATIPFAGLFGPTAFSARLVSALSGIGIVVLIYLITKLLFNQKTGLLAAFLGSISPWGISLSRGGFETNFALFLALFGVYAFLKVPNPLWLIVSAIAFAVSMQTYATYRMIIPLFVGTILIFNFKRVQIFFQKSSSFITLSALTIFLASIVMSFYLTFSIGDRDRFSTINIFQDPTSQSVITQKVGLERAQVSLPKPLVLAFHNKFIEFSGVFLKNYLSHFSLEFLFLSGDGNPRHNPAGIGQLYLITIIPLILALIILYRTKRKVFLFLIFWILVTPIAASLVGEAHALRSSFMLPPLLILAAVGISKILNLTGKFLRLKRFLLVILLLFTAVQFIYLLERVYLMAPGMYSSFWSHQAKQAAIKAYQDKKNFDFVILSNDIPNMEYAYPTYNRLDPLLVIAQNKQKTKVLNYSFFAYENVYIGSLPNGEIDSFLNALPGSAFYIGPDLIKIEKPKSK